MNDEFKDVTINGTDFRVGRVTPMTGNWITMQLASQKYLEEENFAKIQSYLLSTCSYYKITSENTANPGVRVPMKAFDGGRALTPLLNDLDTHNALYKAAMDFNFSDFFKKRKAEQDEAERLAAIQATT
jgi:hypothetical protein